MKKKIFILCAALVWTITLMAQNIAVVTADGSTSLFRTLDEAIAFVNENDGCVVYLPGGGFNINTTITKKVTIIGIGHKIQTDNVDGYTTINGYVRFVAGSSGSAIMGCYLINNIDVGWLGVEVNDVLIRYCNANYVSVSAPCKGTIINQCYLRDGCGFSSAGGEFTHNICKYIRDFKNGTIANNIFTGRYNGTGGRAMDICEASIIKYNVILDNTNGFWSGSGSAERNMAQGTENWDNGGLYDVDPIDVTGVEWTDIFENPDGANPTSNYHFKEAYKQYESQVGLYANGVQFDNQLPPVPYIVAKQIGEQTDASGKLSVKIRVKAGGEE